MPTDNPHDRFFKETFSQFDVLTDFARVFLPNTLWERLDFGTISREADSFVDEELSEHFADLIFSVQLAHKPIRIALLLEHKSYPEPYPHFQLNRYLLNYWQHQIKQKQPLVPVLPIVVYHGNKRWRYRSMTEYFTGLDSSIVEYIPAFTYVLFDLSRATTDKLAQLQTDYARLTAYLLRTIRHRQRLVATLNDLAQEITRLAETQTGARFIGTVAIYLNWASGLTTYEIIAIFRSISVKSGDVVMSAAETLINQGIEQGVKQGAHQTLLKGIKGMLKLGMSTDAIAAAFELSLSEAKALIEAVQKGEY